MGGIFSCVIGVLEATTGVNNKIIFLNSLLKLLFAHDAEGVDSIMSNINISTQA